MATNAEHCHGPPAAPPTNSPTAELLGQLAILGSPAPRGSKPTSAGRDHVRQAAGRHDVERIPRPRGPGCGWSAYARPMGASSTWPRTAALATAGPASACRARPPCPLAMTLSTTSRPAPARPSRCPRPDPGALPRSRGCAMPGGRIAQQQTRPLRRQRLTHGFARRLPQRCSRSPSSRSRSPSRASDASWPARPILGPVCDGAGHPQPPSARASRTSMVTRPGNDARAAEAARLSRGRYARRVLPTAISSPGLESMKPDRLRH